MVFSSLLFLFYFLPVALLLYYAAPGRTKHVVLTAVSYLFYGWANPLRYLGRADEAWRKYLFY